VSKKTAVITGGAGFIGSHLAEELANRNYQIIVLDDLSTGKMANIESVLAKSDVKFVPGSVTDLALLNKLFQNTDYIFHLAAITSVSRSVEAPLASHGVNITGTLNVLMAAKASKVKKLVYASSAAVYGDTATLPQSEDVLPAPQSPYAVAKLCGEHYCRVFQEVYGLNTACLRYFNVYGPGQDPNSQYAAVIPRFISRVLEGKPPIIFGDGEQTRDFTFVKDAVQATIMAAESDATGVFNVGTGHRASINELARLIATIMGSAVAAVHEKPRPGDIKHSQANISKAREIGYRPRYSLEEGLRETIKGWQK
jgi:UDP-glucose 4-epimerase